MYLRTDDKVFQRKFLMSFPTYFLKKWNNESSVKPMKLYKTRGKITGILYWKKQRNLETYFLDEFFYNEPAL